MGTQRKNPTKTLRVFAGAPNKPNKSVQKKNRHLYRFFFYLIIPRAGELPSNLGGMKRRRVNRLLLVSCLTLDARFPRTREGTI